MFSETIALWSPPGCCARPPSPAVDLSSCHASDLAAKTYCRQHRPSHYSFTFTSRSSCPRVHKQYERITLMTIASDGFVFL